MMVSVVQKEMLGHDWVLYRKRCWVMTECCTERDVRS